MKKNLIIVSAAACALVFALAGCGSGGQAAPAAGSEAGSAPAEAPAAIEETSAISETSVLPSMPNPWSDVASAEEAAQGAGLSSFAIPEGANLSLGPIDNVAYRCMDGIAEAQIEFPAVTLTIRKGIAVDGDDISGDYNEYANTWDTTLKGLTVTCFGNREGEATKTIWSANGFDYSINALGLGGDDDFGLSADDLNSLINGMQ